jgi:hypothetical protein
MEHADHATSRAGNQTHEADMGLLREVADQGSHRRRFIRANALLRQQQPRLQWRLATRGEHRNTSHHREHEEEKAQHDQHDDTC